MGEFRSEIESGESPFRGCLTDLGTLICWSVFLIPIGMIIGGLLVELGQHHRRFSAERRIIAPVLAADPSLSGIELMMDTGDGSAYLAGEVKTKDDKERLRARTLKLFGETRVDDLMYAVGVRKN